MKQRIAQLATQKASSTMSKDNIVLFGLLTFLFCGDDTVYLDASLGHDEKECPKQRR